MVGPIIAALLTNLVAGAAGGYAVKRRREEEEQAASREGLVKKAEKIAEQGDHETYESIIPHLQKAGVDPNVIDTGRTIARSKAGQIWRQETQAGMEPSVTPPPNILSSLMRGQEGGADAGDYFDNATSTDVTTQRGAAGLPPIDTETARFRASAFQPPAQPAPVAQPTTGIQVAPARGAQTIQTPTGTRSTKEITGKEITSDAISQARTQGLHPREVHVALDLENARRKMKGQPPLDVDDTALVAYDLEHFETRMNQTRRDLESQGVDPKLAFDQAVQETYKTTGLVPEKYKSMIQPKEGELASHAYINAVNHVGTVISQLRDPGAISKMFEPGFLAKQINMDPHIKPEDSIRATHVAAQQLMQSIMPKLKAQYPQLSDTQLAGLAVKISAYATGGEVPKEWHEAVMGNPTAFGYSPEQAAAMAASGINPLEPGAGAKAQDVISDITLKKDFRKSYMEAAQTPEGRARAYDELQKRGTQPAPATAKTPGEIDREIQKQQKGTLSRQDREQEQEFSKTPSGEIDKLTALDNIYTTGVRLQQLAVQKDPQGKTLLDKYGNYPGTFIDWYRKASGALGNTDPQLRKYTDLLGKIFNIEKKTFAGVAVNVAERKDLLQFMPDPGDNVRTGLMKINDLVQTTDLELANKVEYYKTNYPKTDFTSFGHQKIRSARAAQKAK